MKRKVVVALTLSRRLRIPFEVFLLGLTIWLLPLWIDLFNPQYWKALWRSLGG